MSQRREKKRRRQIRWDYQWDLQRWKRREPPWWRFLAHWMWKKDKPKMPKEGLR